MLGSPPRPPRLWPDPPPAHTNGFGRYLCSGLDNDFTRGVPRIAHLAQPQTYQPPKVEEQLFTGYTRSVSQVHQVISEETTNSVRKAEHCPCKPSSGWSVKTTIREGGCSRTTPRCVVKTEPGQPTPCQVQEVTTSCKTTCTDLQASSPHGSSPSSSSYCVLGRGIVSQRNFYSTSSSSTSSLMDGNKNARGGSTTGNIPVGIAIARQRVQQQTTPPPLTVVTCQERQTNQGSAWPLAPPHWQIQGNGVDQGLPLQPPHMGLQLGRDPVSGQFVLFPSTGIGDSVQRAVVWPGSTNVPPPPLQVMQAPPPQPLLLDRLVALAPGHDKRRHDPPPLTGVMVPCDFSKGAGSGTSGSTCLGQATATSQGLALIHNIHPGAATPHQFSSVLIHQMPFATGPPSSQQHNNSLLLSTQLTEQALINQNLNTSVVISNHQLSENTVINPQLLGGMEGLCGLQHMSPSVVISHHHTETNSFVRSDIGPVIPGHVLIKEEVKQEIEEEEEHHPPPLVDQATSPPSVGEDTKSEFSEEDIKERVVQDAQNQTETPAVSDEDTCQPIAASTNQTLIPVVNALEQVKKENDITEPVVTCAVAAAAGDVATVQKIVEEKDQHNKDEVVEAIVPQEVKVQTQIQTSVAPASSALPLPIAVTTNDVKEQVEVKKDQVVSVELPEPKIEESNCAIYSPEDDVQEECEPGQPDLSGMQLLLNGIDQYETVRAQVPTEEQCPPIEDTVIPPISPPPAPPATGLHGLGLLCELARQRIEIEGSEEPEPDVEQEPEQPEPEAEGDLTPSLPTTPNEDSSSSSITCSSSGSDQRPRTPPRRTPSPVPSFPLIELDKDNHNDSVTELKNQVKSQKLLFKRGPGRPKKNSYGRCKKELPPVSIPILSEPPVLEPWCASPSQKNHPLLSPPTLTPNKRKSLDSPSHSSQESDSCGNPPPLSPCSSSKKRKVGRPRKSEEPTNTETIVSQRNKGLVGLLLHSNSHDEKEPSPPPTPKVNKIRPKLKAEAKVKAWCDDDEIELSPPKPKLEPQFKSSPAWRFSPVGKSTPKRAKSRSPEKRRKISPSGRAVVCSKTNSRLPPVVLPFSPKINSNSSAVQRKVSTPSPVNTSKSTVTTSTNSTSSLPQIVPSKSENCQKSTDKTSTISSTPQSSQSDLAVTIPAETDSKSDMPDCKLREEHLTQLPRSIMMAVGGLFYTGHITQAKAEGIYEVILEKERHRKPHILCSEELINNAILEVRLDDVALKVGTRLCAYWSQQYNCLYPGVVCSTSGPNDKFVSVEFDDGDNGTINRDDIRLLPHDYPMIEYDPNPLSSLGKRKRHNSTNSSDCQNKNVERSLPTPEPPSLVEKSNVEDILEESEKMEIDPSNEKQDEESEAEPTLPAETIPSIISVLESEQERKRLKKKRKKKLSLLKNAGKLHRHKHKEGCKTRHKRKHKHHRKHKHKHSSESGEMRIKESTVSIDDEGANEKGPLITTIIKPAETSCTKKKCNDHKVPPVANGSKSKIAAFLPARHEMWDWRGPGVKRGRAVGHRGPRKTFYKAIQRGSDVIKVGDCAVFVSTGRPDRPFIGQVESLWATKKNSMAVKVSWFYHPEETIGAPDNLPYPGALFKSPHTDSNDVQTISHRCEVISLAEFAKKAAEKDFIDTVYENHDTYYLAGHYDPHDTKIEFEPGIG
ncbi:BAH domain and coiled-coil containing protein winged eye isoform X3 [Rhodnius prolixus]|uniref:BAH domain and coiled-coil containing protein winged eye isoform X3 n=1 Tax=Rhodnius prolixus TaxID=13249 RepID=UPI003D1879A0